MQLTQTPKGSASLILAAALALPGTVCTPAHAQTVPEHGQIGFKYLRYRDWQPELNRISVSAPSVYGLFPIAGKWSVEGSATLDSVSGASPRWHSAVSSASHMSDTRRAFDIKTTRYWERSTLSLSAAYSNEHDYRSRALSLSGTVSSEDNNRTWAYGLGIARDNINPVNNVVINARKRTTDAMFGLTQVLGRQDIAQFNFTIARGRGYYDDPYKFPDKRPDFRNQYALMTRWNHHYSGWDATSRLSYRYYKDSYRVNAHTVTAEWVQTLPGGWTVTPLLRLHSQSAARFYYDPVYDQALGEPFPPGWTAAGLHSADQRLSAFGGRTIGLKVSKELPEGWTIDARYDLYRQRAGYRIFGNGSPGLSVFNASFLQLGVSKKLE